MCWGYDTIQGGTKGVSIQVQCCLSSKFVIKWSDTALKAHSIHFKSLFSPLLIGVLLPWWPWKPPTRLKNSLFLQWGKKGKFSLFKMAVHNPSMEHKRVCRLGKMDGGPHARLNKKVFKPSSRSSSQGSMILKTGRELGLVNVMDRQESLKAPRG